MMNIAGVRLVSQTLKEVAMRSALTYRETRNLKSGMQSSLALVSFLIRGKIETTWTPLSLCGCISWEKVIVLIYQMLLISRRGNLVFWIPEFSLLFQGCKCSKVWCCMTVLENVVFEEHSREVDYADKSVTGNFILVCTDFNSGKLYPLKGEFSVLNRWQLDGC